MIPLLEIRQKIKTALDDKLGGLVSVEYAPEKPREYAVLHPNGSALIEFTGTSFSEPDIMQQTALINFNIELCLRAGYNGECGLQILDLVRQTMTTQININGLGFYCTGQTNDGEENGVWFYSNNFILPQIIRKGD